VPTHILGFDLAQLYQSEQLATSSTPWLSWLLGWCTVTTHVCTYEALAGSLYQQLVLHFTPGIYGKTCPCN